MLFSTQRVLLVLYEIKNICTVYYNGLALHGADTLNITF